MFKKQLFSLLSLLLVITFAVGCSKSQEQEQPKQIPLVSATKAFTLDIPWNKEYPAQVAGSLEVEVRAQVGGILKERLYNEGQFVEKDTVLFTIDPQEYQIALEKAQASLEQENTQVQKAKRDYERMKSLISDNAVSQKDYDDSLSAYEKAQADYKAAKAVVDDAKRNLGYAKVKAPISGIARKENHSVGSLISLNGDNSLLTTMVQINPLHVVFSVPGKQLAQLKDAIEQERMAISEEKVVVDVLVGNKVYPYSGQIIFFDSAEDPQTSAFAVKVEVPNPDSKFDMTPGQFVKVRIRGITFKNAVLVPQSSLVENPNGTFVYVVNTSSNNVIEAVPVSAEVKDSIAVVFDGLKGDETVISGGSLKVQPGIPVKFELKNIDLPEDFKQAYAEKYGQPLQDENQQEENQNQEGQTENNEQQQTSEPNNEQQTQQQDNNNEQQGQQQEQPAENNEQK